MTNGSAREITASPAVWPKSQAVMPKYNTEEISQRCPFCDPCTRDFPNGYELLNHIMENHVSEFTGRGVSPKSQTVYRCFFKPCSKTDLWLRNMESHFCGHLGIKPFECPHIVKVIPDPENPRSLKDAVLVPCEKRYVQSSSLRSHLKHLHAHPTSLPETAQFVYHRNDADTGDKLELIIKNMKFTKARFQRKADAIRANIIARAKENHRTPQEEAVVLLNMVASLAPSGDAAPTPEANPSEPSSPGLSQAIACSTPDLRAGIPLPGSMGNDEHSVRLDLTNRQDVHDDHATYNRRRPSGRPQPRGSAVRSSPSESALPDGGLDLTKLDGPAKISGVGTSTHHKMLAPPIDAILGPQKRRASVAHLPSQRAHRASRPYPIADMTRSSVRPTQNHPALPQRVRYQNLATMESPMLDVRKLEHDLDFLLHHPASRNVSTAPNATNPISISPSSTVDSSFMPSSSSLHPSFFPSSNIGLSNTANATPYNNKHDLGAFLLNPTELNFDAGWSREAQGVDVNSANATPYNTKHDLGAVSLNPAGLKLDASWPHEAQRLNVFGTNESINRAQTYGMSTRSSRPLVSTSQIVGPSYSEDARVYGGQSGMVLPGYPAQSSSSTAWPSGNPAQAPPGMYDLSNNPYLRLASESAILPGSATGSLPRSPAGMYNSIGPMSSRPYLDSVAPLWSPGQSSSRSTGSVNNFASSSLGPYLQPTYATPGLEPNFGLLSAWSSENPQTTLSVQDASQNMSNVSSVDPTFLNVPPKLTWASTTPDFSGTSQQADHGSLYLPQWSTAESNGLTLPAAATGPEAYAGPSSSNVLDLSSLQAEASALVQQHRAQIASRAAQRQEPFLTGMSGYPQANTDYPFFPAEQ